MSNADEPQTYIQSITFSDGDLFHMACAKAGWDAKVCKWKRCSLTGQMIIINPNVRKVM